MIEADGATSAVATGCNEFYFRIMQQEKECMVRRLTEVKPPFGILVMAHFLPAFRVLNPAIYLCRMHEDSAITCMYFAQAVWPIKKALHECSAFNGGLKEFI